MNHNEFFLFKVLTFGDRNVGKSSFISMCCDGKIEENYETQVDDTFKTKTFINGGVNSKVQIWELGKMLNRNSDHFPIRGIHGIIIFYDVTNSDSYKSCREKWLPDILRYTDESIAKFLVGTKIDLIGDDNENRKVFYQEGKKLANEIDIDFKEISNINNEDIDEVMNILMKKMILVHKERLKNISNVSNIDNVKEINYNKKDKKEKENCVIN